MNLRPLLDLRERLRTCMVVRANQSAEDLRLIRIISALAPLEEEYPEVTPLRERLRALTAADCPDRAGTLLEVAALTDSVLCSLTDPSVSGTAEPLRPIQESFGRREIPCSVLAPFRDAMSAPGSGNFTMIQELLNQHPEYLQDSRMVQCLIDALGASYGELGDLAEQRLQELGPGVIPLLKRGFDSRGGREMARRVHLLERMAGPAENEFYLQMLPKAKKMAGAALIYALRLCPENAEILIRLAVEEKGECRRRALYALARMESPVADKFWLSTDKIRRQAVQYGAYSIAPSVCQVTVEALEHWCASYQSGKRVPSARELDSLRSILMVVPGKCGQPLCDALRKLVQLADRLSLEGGRAVPFRMKLWRVRVHTTLRDALAEVLQRALLVRPAPGLLALARELRSEPGFAYVAMTADLLTLDAKTAFENAEPFFAGQQDMEEILEPLLYYMNCDYRDLHRTCFSFLPQDPVFPDSRSYIHCPLHEELDTRWFREFFRREWSREMLNHLYWLIPLDNPEVREMGGAYFYNYWLRTGPGINHLQYLCRLGWQKCEGLAVRYAETHTSGLSVWNLIEVLKVLPGSAESRQREAQALLDRLAVGDISFRGDLESLRAAMAQSEEGESGLS